METFAVILFLIACVGIIFSIVQLVRYATKKQNNKKNKKLLFGFIILAIVSFIILGNASSTDTGEAGKVANSSSVESSALTVSDENLLKKHYKNFSVSERTQFSEIEDKYEKLSSKEKEKIKTNYDRLLKEQDIQVAEWQKEEEAAKKAKEKEEAKKQEELIKKNTKKLSAGEHIVGKHLDAGTYDITFNGSGNFYIYASDESLLTNEIGGGELGITKYRAILPEGAKIKLSGVSINTKPIKSSLSPYGNTTIYTGYWIVGQDITAGRYKASPQSGSGNFFIYGNDGSVKTNEILGGDMGVNEVVVNLQDGDIINVASLKNVKLIPTK